MPTKLYTKVPVQKDYVFEKIFDWKSPDRSWEPKTKVWFISYSFFFVILIALAALMGEYILIIAIIAFVFLWFVQGSVPPEIIHHSVTNIGIKTYGKLYKWKDIKHFWFSEKNEVRFLNLVLHPPINKDISPKTLTLLLGKNEDDDTLFKILVKFTDYGDKDEISYTMLTQLIHGTHIDISYYLPEEESKLPKTTEKKDSQVSDKNKTVKKSQYKDKLKAK